MSLSLKDVRLTTRRTDGELRLFPRLLRDRSVLPKIRIASRYLESMVGRERADFEPETLVHFFGDHKIARCILACIGRTYRFRAPTVAERVSRTALRRLSRLDADTPRGLRLLLFGRVNASDHGFLPTDARAERFAHLESELGLRRDQLEDLLWLDAEEHAILERVGAEPTPEDVAVAFNVGVLTCLLRHAERVDLTLPRMNPAQRDGLYRLAAANDVSAWLDEEREQPLLRLEGRQDAMGGWSRAGRRLVRLIVELLERDRGLLLGGTATVALRDRRGKLQLTDEVLDVLAGAPGPSSGWLDLPGWGAEEIRDALAASRPALAGSSVRRLPDPQPWRAGLLVPDLLAQVDGHRALVTAVRSLGHAERLAPIARGATTGEPLAFVGDPRVLGPLRSVGARTIPMVRFDVGAAVASLPGLFAHPAAEQAA